MLKALKTLPGIQNPRLGIATSNGWTHPFLEYQPSEKARWIQPTRFDALKPADVEHGPYSFQAIVPGLMPAGQQRLDLHVTERVVREWKEQCGVRALILSI